MFRKLILLVVLCMPLSCGFHLRGSIELPSSIAPLYVERYGVDSNLSREIRGMLSQSTTNNLASSKAEATAELVLISVKNKRRVIAVDNRGRVRQYELDYRVSYTVTGKDLPAEDGKDNTREVRLTRDLLFDPDSVLAISHEQEMLYKDMRKDAARLILQQLKSLGRKVTDK